MLEKTQDVLITQKNPDKLWLVPTVQNLALRIAFAPIATSIQDVR
jgi:hypothetical protein